MNDQQRAAMQMALEALEAIKNTNSYWWQEVHESDLNNMDNAITALREALAQPTIKDSLTVQPQGEWVDLTDAQISLMAFNDCEEDWDSLSNKRCWLDGYEIGAREAIKDFKKLNTPPSVEAAIEATKEKAAKVCEELGETNKGFPLSAKSYAAAIRSLK